jgi:hypothetical protein
MNRKDDIQMTGDELSEEDLRTVSGGMQFYGKDTPDGGTPPPKPDGTAGAPILDFRARWGWGGKEPRPAPKPEPKPTPPNDDKPQPAPPSKPGDGAPILDLW